MFLLVLISGLLWYNMYRVKGLLMKRNQVILIYGLPASGKYTMAKQIQEKCGGILLDNHYFYDMFQNIVKVPQEFKHEYFRKVGELRNVFLDIVKRFHSNETTTRFIFTSTLLGDEDFPNILEKFAKDLCADLITIGLSASDDILLNRCDTEYRKSRKKISNMEKYSKLLPDMKTKQIKCSNKNNLILDTDNMSKQQTFEQIQKYLKQFD